MMVNTAFPPAIRCAAVGMPAIMASCGWAAQDACHDDGGVWDAELSQCYCSRRQVRSDDDWGKWCADLTDLNSIKKKVAVTPAPTGD